MASKGWSMRPLASCCIGRPKYGANAPAIVFNSSLPRYVRITDISDEGNLREDKKVSIQRKDVNGSLLMAGDVLFARTGATVGKTYLHENVDGEYAFAGYLIRFKPNPKILLSEFLKIYSETDHYWTWIRSISRAGAQPNINGEEYGGLNIPCPPIEEQRNIVSIASYWSRQIWLLQGLTITVQKLKIGLMRQLLTGKMRFYGFKGKWTEHKLGELFEERNEVNGRNLSLLSVTGELGVIAHSESGRKDSSSEDKSKYKRVVTGDIAYNTMRMWQGVSALSRLEGIVSPAYTICIPKNAIYGPFAAHLFKFSSMIHRFFRYSQGLVGDTLNLKFNHFSEIKVTVPLINEQKRIASVLDAIDSEIFSLKKLVDQYKEQKRGLMQKLLMGQIRVKINSKE